MTGAPASPTMAGPPMADSGPTGTTTPDGGSQVRRPDHVGGVRPSEAGPMPTKALGSGRAGTPLSDSLRRNAHLCPSPEESGTIPARLAMRAACTRVRASSFVSRFWT